MERYIYIVTYRSTEVKDYLIENAFVSETETDVFPSLERFGFATESARLAWSGDPRTEQSLIDVLPMIGGDGTPELWEFRDGFASVFVEGDWKHAHAALDSNMYALGYAKVSERETEFTGDDWYPSVHKYKVAR